MKKEKEKIKIPPPPQPAVFLLGGQETILYMRVA